MEKTLDSFNTIVEMFNQYANKPNDIGEFFRFTTACQKVEKALKALEIIKDKQVDTLWLTDSDDKSLDGYNEMMLDSMGAKRYKELTQDEYDLLMEVLA